MKKKIISSILFLSLNCYASISLADSMADAVFSDQDTNISDNQPNNILNTQIYVQKTYYSINDVINTLSLYNAKSMVSQQGNSSNIGYKISNSSNIQNFLNEVCPKLGYTYTVNSNNIIVFKSIVPITPVQVIAPKPVPVVLATPTSAPSKVNVSSLLPLKVESKPIESKPTNSPYKPKITTETQKFNGVWVMNVDDKTIKTTFAKWAKQSGWNIVWDSNYDFPIRSGMEIEGNLDYAINEVCRASTVTGVQMLATIASKNKTIVITTPNI